MSYIKENLIRDENILYQCRLHWVVVFPWPIIWLIVAVVIFINGGHWAMLGGSITAAIAVFKAIESFITYSTSEFGVTNYRVIAKVGFIRRKSLEVLLSKIESIRVNQTVLGRIIGYGSITISGTGGTHDLFPYISDPLKLRRKIQEQIITTQSSFR
ncbi:MAG: PH domain-containing protein [Syntrophobacteraceae bacterium]|nr:PH domain-containing protein [Syntrophobacteraceae bacterium]